MSQGRLSYTVEWTKNLIKWAGSGLRLENQDGQIRQADGSWGAYRNIGY